MLFDSADALVIDSPAVLFNFLTPPSAMLGPLTRRTSLVKRSSGLAKRIGGQSRGRTRRLGFQSLEHRRVLANLLVAGIDSPPASDTNHAAVSIIDLDDREVSPVVASSALQNFVPPIGPRIATEGIAGLAIDADGRLITVANQVRPTLRGNPRPTDPFGTPAAGGISDLVVRASTTGPIVGRMALRFNGAGVEIDDLTILPATGQLLGVTSFRSAPGEGFLVEIDPDSGLVTPIGPTGLTGAISIAAADDGTLYAATQANGFSPLVLHTLDPATGAVLTSDNVVDAVPFGVVTGLAVEPGTGVIYGAETVLGRIFQIDPLTLVRTVVDTQPPQRGVTGDLAFEPVRTGAAIEQLLHVNFESGLQGFTIDNSIPAELNVTDGAVPGLWHRTTGRSDDDQLNHSPNHAAYFGAFEGPIGRGHYVLGVRTRGVLTSPEVAIPATGTSILSFSYLLDTRPDFNRDFVTVSIDNGVTDTVVLSRTAGTLPETLGDWLTATVDLAAYAGQTIRVNYTFDTNDPVRIDPEGWYVDDVVIAHLAAPPSTDVDLGVVKTASAPSFVAGQPLTYTLTVTNDAAAPATADTFTVTDNLPAGATFVSADGGGIFDPGTRVVTWTGGPLAPGQAATFNVTIVPDLPAAGVDPLVCGDVLTNVAEVSAGVGIIDVNPGDNRFTLETPVTCVDLSVVKTASLPSFRSGEELTYTLTVTNAADAIDTADTFSLTDILSAGVTFVGASGSGTEASGEVTWTGGPLAPGQSASFTVTVMVNQTDADDPIVCGDILTNTAAVATAVGVVDDDLANNQVVLNIPAACVDLIATKSSSPTSTTVGQAFTFTLGVINRMGEMDTATGVTVRDTLPVGLTFDPILSTPGAVLDPANRTVTWNAPDLAPGLNATYQLVATVDGPVRFDPATLINSVVVNSNEPDRMEPDNTATIDVIVDPAARQADISVTKTADKTSVVEGEQLTYTIVVTNQPPAAGVDPDSRTATPVTVVDTLPAGVTVVSVNRAADSETDRTDAIFPDTLTWQIAGLAVGASETFTVVVEVPVRDDCERSTLSNSVTAVGTSADPALSNNQATVTTSKTCIPLVDLAITKQVDAANPLPGDLLTYTITVENLSTTTTATGVVVTDLLPAGLTFAGSSVTVNNQTYAIGNLDPGQRSVFSISALVDMAPPALRLINTASVTADQNDPNAGNNMDDVVTILTQTVQFITPLAVHRPSDVRALPVAPFSSRPSVASSTQLPAGPIISGYLWADVDANGSWQEGIEQPSAGVPIYLDLNNNGVNDQFVESGVSEPAVVTDLQGRYLFVNPPVGEYTIRVDSQERRGGPLLVPTYPIAQFEQPSFTTRPGSVADQEITLPVAVGHRINFKMGDRIIGEQFLAMEPNIGQFFYSPLTRPADQFTALYTGETNDTAASAIATQHRTATLDYQTFEYVNDFASQTTIESINVMVGVGFEPYVSIYRLPADNVGVPTKINVGTQSIMVGPGQRVRFAAVYDPAIRPSAGVVSASSPDWENPGSDVHQFGGTQRIELNVSTTGSDIETYPVRLTGFSTYDSDITYDGDVQVDDVNRLLALLDSGTGVIRESDPGFDRTADINARHPDGAEQVVGQTVWTEGGPRPLREIGLGDYGPLAVEARLAGDDPALRRPIVLDLDVSNDHSPGGLDYGMAVSGSAGAIAIADTDAFFATVNNRVMPDFQIRILNPLAGDRLVYSDSSTAPDPQNFAATLLEPDALAGTTLTFTDKRIDALTYALRQITLVPDSAATGVRTIVIEFSGSQLAQPVTSRITVGVANRATSAP